MSQRFDITKASPANYQAMRALSRCEKDPGLDQGLLEMVKIRVSQINGCAFCIAMHLAEARRLEVGRERLDLLPAWREAQCYSPRERAALAWAEAMTLLPGGEVPDAVYDETCRHFSVGELSDLSFAITVINGWNRLMIASRTPPARA